MTRAEDRQFHRGKDARRRGLDRQHPDGRASHASRQAFYAGWDEQARYMAPVATLEQRAATHEMLAKLKEGIQAL